jgi:lactate dehydrogenase-like 2-hydroxyacid dehydrogenase
MHVLYTGPRPKPGPYEYVSDIRDLATRSNFLVLTTPGGDATRHLVDATVLGALGPEGFLVNVSRGSVVHESALLDALEAGGIAGAGLDVFGTEPNIDPRFLRLHNVVLQPHNASITRETRAAMIGRIVSDIEAFLEGRPFHDAAAGQPR